MHKLIIKKLYRLIREYCLLIGVITVLVICVIVVLGLIPIYLDSGNYGNTTTPGLVSRTTRRATTIKSTRSTVRTTTLSRLTTNLRSISSSQVINNLLNIDELTVKPELLTSTEHLLAANTQEENLLTTTTRIDTERASLSDFTTTSNLLSFQNEQTPGGIGAYNFLANLI